MPVIDAIWLYSLPASLRVTEQILKAEATEAANAKQEFADLLVHSVVRRQVAGSSDSASPTIIAEEPGEVSIRLCNPYSVPLQVDSVDLL